MNNIRGKKFGHEQDDRVPLASERRRRVTFKNCGPNHMSNEHSNRSNWHKNKFEKMRAALTIGEACGDVEIMTGCSFQNRGQNRFNGGNQIRGLERRGCMRRHSPYPGVERLLDSSYHFYKVIISEGHKYERDYIIGLLQSFIKPFTFTPLGLGVQNDKICFYVDNHKVGEQIMQADRKITTSDNCLLGILVKPITPHVDVDERLKALMKVAMSTRYNITTKALDLTCFHSDPVMLKENVFCPLNRTHVMQAVIQIVGDSVPDLVALKLSENNLLSAYGLKKLKARTPNLKVLHISNNKVQSLHSFDFLQGLPLEEIVLDGNPLCDEYRDKDVYIREVQKIFPKVVRLDGKDVPQAITFKVEEEIMLPKSQGSFLCTPAVAEVIKPFLQQYYQIYDSENRTPLIDAYHENAQFSLSCSHHNAQDNSMAPYEEDSRNLLVVTNPEKHKRLLRRGKADIVTYLTTLPRTEHDPSSLVVDCSVFMPTMIMMSVTGVFREVGGHITPLRSFHRSFVIVPVGSGFCIINELLHINPATSNQTKAAFKPPQPVAPAVPPAVVPPVAVAGVSSAPGIPVVPVAPVVDISTQQQMVSTLAMQSGMNLQFSEMCLSENNWEFERAVYIFSELQKQGIIPPEAFIK